MTISKISKAIIAVVGTANLMTAQAKAAESHTDRASCHAYIYAQCHPNGQNVCDADDYNWGYEECDAYYPSVGVKPPKPSIGGFKAVTKSSKSLRSAVKRSFKAK